LGTKITCKNSKNFIVIDFVKSNLENRIDIDLKLKTSKIGKLKTKK